MFWNWKKKEGMKNSRISIPSELNMKTSSLSQWMDMTGIFLLEKKKELRMLFSSRHCYLEIHLYFLHLLLILLQICDHFISYIRKFFTKYFYIILWTFGCMQFTSLKITCQAMNVRRCMNYAGKWVWRPRVKGKALKSVYTLFYHDECNIQN